MMCLMNDNERMLSVRQLVEPVMTELYLAVTSAQDEVHANLEHAICQEAASDYNSQLGTRLPYQLRRELFQRLPGTTWVRRSGLHLVHVRDHNLMIRAGTATRAGQIRNAPQERKGLTRRVLASFMKRDASLFADTDAQPIMVGALRVDADRSRARAVVPVYRDTTFVDAWEILPARTESVDAHRRLLADGETPDLEIRRLHPDRLIG